MKIYTKEEIFACLVTCDKLIRENAYKAKKWKNYGDCAYESYEDVYLEKANEWREYQTVIRSVLIVQYTLKEIIQYTKQCTAKPKPATQKAVREMVAQIQKNECRVVNECVVKSE